MKTIGTVFSLIVIMFFVPDSWGEDSVFTNKDLQKYQDKGTPTATVTPKNTISYSDLMKRSGKLQPVCTDEVKAQLKAKGGGCEEWREGERPVAGKKDEIPQKPILREDEEVMVSIVGCPTLQEALDGKTGNTNAVIAVIRHGRTIEEICDTVGQGCKSCGEAPRQLGKNSHGGKQ